MTPLTGLRIAGVNVGLFMERPSTSAAVQSQEDGKQREGLPRWEMVSDVTALEEEAADAEITAAASATGFTSLHLDTQLNGGGAGSKTDRPLPWTGLRFLSSGWGQGGPLSLCILHADGSSFGRPSSGKMHVTHVGHNITKR
jgi:hypothetical protein